MPNVKLSKIHRAIMFISTKSLSEGLENKVKEVIEEELGDKMQFVGRCFGRFDMVAEFDEKSAKVASHKVCEIQEKAANKLRESGKEVGRDPICSSLMLCNEFVAEGAESRNEDTSSNPILKLYSFLYPRRAQVNLEDALIKLEKIREELTGIAGDANLFFSSSNYTFLLMISGNMFCKMFEQFMEFREETQDSFLESCSYVAIGWDKEDHQCEDGRSIRGYVFVKLKDGFGDSGMKEEGIIKSVYKRFGWSDISLEVEAPTLHEMKRKILELRKNYGNVIYTSTLLLPEREGV